MYYRYDERCILVEESTEPTDAERVCKSDVDFDVDIYTVYVGNVREGILTKYTAKVKPAEQLAKNLKATNETVAVLKTETSELREYSAELLYKMCLLQLGITEEELVEVENTEESEV